MEANEAYIEEIKQIVTEHTPGYYNVIVHQKPYLVEYINNWCCGHDLSKFAEKVYWTVNHMTEFPKCENPGCDKLLTSKQF
jgi:hypothetical protein